jgi:hypothetical protein
VGIYPWRQPPGETYETTDIWVDSPLNGYGIYRYGSWNDLSGMPGPRVNGDDPAIGSINRVYARVRNFGTANAVNVRVKFKVTDPLGVGVQNTNWALVGDGLTVTSAQFPALASIPPGGFVDVYKEWTPNPTLSAAQQAAGVFSFHSCLRVEIETVAGESILGNQDGESEQENIQNFEATPTRSPIFDHVFDIVNNKNANRIINIFQKNNLPEGWEIRINGGDSAIGVAPMTNVTVPVSVTATGASVIGSSFTVQFTAAEAKLLDNPDAAVRYHPTMTELGGYNFTVNVLADTQKDMAYQFASPGADKYAGVDYQLTEAFPAPVIEGCTARFYCEVHQVLDGGDHHIILARVLRYDTRDVPPLLFAKGQMMSLDTCTAA